MRTDPQRAQDAYTYVVESVQSLFDKQPVRLVGRFVFGVEHMQKQDFVQPSELSL